MPHLPDADATPRHMPHQFHWRSGAVALAVIVLTFAVPAIALCKIVPLATIVWAIAVTTLAAGAGLCIASRMIEARTPLRDGVDRYLQAGILVTAAGLLWLHVAMQPAPWRERTVAPVPALTIALACGVAGALLLVRRDRRLENARRNMKA